MGAPTPTPSGRPAGWGDAPPADGCGLRADLERLGVERTVAGRHRPSPIVDGPRS